MSKKKTYPLAVLLAAAAPCARGLDTYTGPSGNWSDGSNWSLGAPPGNGETVFLQGLVGGANVITFDAPAAVATNLALVTIGVTNSAGSVTLLQSTGSMVGYWLDAGPAVTSSSSPNGVGNVSLSGGSQSFHNVYVFGSNTAGQISTFTLSGNAQLTTTGNVLVGDYAIPGAFIQNGGTNTIAYVDLDTNGTYTLNDGTITSATGTNAGEIDVIAHVTPTIFTQTGGLVAIKTINLGGQGHGKYQMTGGVVNVAREVLFNDFLGQFSQSGGTNNAASLGIGGNYFLSAGTLNAGSTSISANGSYLQTGGSASLGPLLIQKGTATLGGGTLLAGATTNNAAFVQTAGSATLGPVSGNGSISLGGGSGVATLNVTNFAQSSVNITDGGALHVIADPLNHYTNTAAVSLTGSGALDLNNHNLLTTTSPATIRQYLIAGYNGGAWNGTAGINSSWAAADTNHATTLGYKDNGDGTTLVAATLCGDTNLNGSVDLADYNTLAANFDKPGDWSQGDFNYDGTVDLADYNLLAANFNKSAAQVGGIDTISAASVPEPMATGVAALAVGAVLARRKKLARRSISSECSSSSP